MLLFLEGFLTAGQSQTRGRYRFTDIHIDIGNIGHFFNIGYRYRSGKNPIPGTISVFTVHILYIVPGTMVCILCMTGIAIGPAGKNTNGS